jgi:hypothetical protein
VVSSSESAGSAAFRWWTAALWRVGLFLLLVILRRLGGLGETKEGGSCSWKVSCRESWCSSGKSPLEKYELSVNDIKRKTTTKQRL